MSTHCDQRQLVRFQVVSKDLGSTEELSGDDYSVTEESKLWPYQAFISYSFDATEQAKMDFVISAMKEYTKYANIKFVRARDISSADIRVTFSSDEQHWTTVGTDALMNEVENATMNLGWISLDKTPAANSVIALHAIGHVLGLVHEGTNSRVASFVKYDEDSIMRYSSVEAISTVGTEYAAHLSDCDKAWLALNYPRAEIKLRAQLEPKAASGQNLSSPPPHPADIKRCINDSFRVLEAYGGFLSPTKSSELNEIIPALLRLMEMVESGDEEVFVTQEDLDNLQMELTRRLEQGPEKDLDDIQCSILLQHMSIPSKPGFKMDCGVPNKVILPILPTLKPVLALYSRVMSKGRITVHEIPPDIADKLLVLLRHAPPRSIFQEIYSLCFASTLVHTVNGTRDDLQQMLHKLLGSLLPQITKCVEIGTPRGQWDLVWGPVIWKENPQDSSGSTDLAWYIAYNDSVVCREGDEPRSTYVIAIAGTQSMSVHTWIKSNLDVLFPVDFKSWVSSLRSDLLGCKLPRADTKEGGAYLARGTARTVWQLLTEEAPQAKAGERRLLDFLRSRSKLNPDTRIIITGHSLGGALSPTLALVLAELEVAPRDRILTYPIAGPSPGNGAFARLFSETFPPIAGKQGEFSKQKHEVWNCNLVNEHDPIPQAWCPDKKASPKQNLRNIEKIIPGPFWQGCTISLVISDIIGDLKGLLYMPIRSQYFSPPPSKVLEDVLPQHIQAYHNYVGITPPQFEEALR